MVMSRVNRSIFLITRLLAKFLLSMTFRMHVEGESNIPLRSSFILLPKHQRWTDIPLLGLSMPRQLYYVAKYELFRYFIPGLLLSSLGGIPLNRAKPMSSRNHISNMIDHLRKGNGLVIFPEGTYYRGYVGHGKSGLLRMIRSHIQVPLIPVGIEYAHDKGRTAVRIHFGRPIEDDGSRTPRELIDQIMDEIAILSRME